MQNETPEPHPVVNSPTGDHPIIIETERFRLFVEGVTDYAIYMLSPTGIVRSWNAGATRFKGYSAAEIIGQHFSRFYSESDKASGLPALALQTAMETGKFEGEGFRIRKDGSRFWATVVIDAIRDHNGELIGFTKITRDVTERRQISEALRASEEQFRLLVQGVTDYAIYMLSVDGLVTNWNLGAMRIKGYDASEVIGSHFSRFYTDSDREAGLPDKALQLAAENGSYESEGWRVRKDGSRFRAHVVIDPVKNILGELVGFAKITRDITERYQATQILEKTKASLFQAQKIESLGRLTGGVAHDFNNLLSVVGNGIEVLRLTMTNPVYSKILDSMERAISRGANLTQQLLSFARQQPLKQDAHDLNQVINTFECVLRRALNSSIEFELKLAPSLPMVMVDATQFEVALLNLVVNSKDAITDGGTVTVETKAVELQDDEINELKAGTYVRVSVADDGEGIAPEKLDKIVEPFFTTKAVGKGTGLGLSQVYGLMRQSNGNMTITSTLGEGTCVCLYLPALVADQSEISSHQNDKILVVDDQREVLDTASELFRALGYEVFSANNGHDAMKVLQRHSDVKLLFSDIVMPGMSGLELAHAALDIIPDLKIVLATGYAAEMLEEREDYSSKFTVIAKPYKISEVVKHIQL